MGGTMNLNPLKKDDNTDALVKALEDANNMGAPQQAAAVAAPDVNAAASMATPDSAAIAADPQVASSGVMPDMPDVSALTTDSTDDSTTTATETTKTPADESTDDSSSNLTFDANDLPEGLSGDADAHLTAPTGDGTGEDGELDDVKKSALEQLRPLIDKLELEPADKFDKYLMMLRASDDPTLIKPAFDAAQGITGEKEKAQALLDIINEINYITANQNNG